jgi:hypothetical protein
VAPLSDPLEGVTVPQPRLSEIDSDSVPTISREPMAPPPRRSPPPAREPTPAERGLIVPAVDGFSAASNAQAIAPPEPLPDNDDSGLALPPMPAPPAAADMLGAVMYLLPLGRAVWARQRAQKVVREQLYGDQRLLDVALGDLGRVAREEQVDVPPIRDELHRVMEQEARRTQSDNESARVDMSVSNERERFAADEHERKATIAALESRARELEGNLRDQRAARATHAAEQARIEGKIRAAEKRAAQAEARARKADVTPPEKGGGPNTAANARREAEAARRESAGFVPDRDAARDRVEELEQPIVDLTRQLDESRDSLKGQRLALAEAQTAHQRTVAAMGEEKRQAEDARNAAERELSQRFVSVGTILNLHRVEGPRFTSLYQRLDQLKAAVTGREATLVRLQRERRAYDRGAVQRGALILGAALGGLILVTVILIVVLSR